MTQLEIERIVAAAGRVLLYDKRLPNNEEAAARAIAKLAQDYIDGRVTFPIVAPWSLNPLEDEGLSGLKKSLKKAAKKVKKAAKKVVKKVAPIAALAAPLLMFTPAAPFAAAVGAAGGIGTMLTRKKAPALPKLEASLAAGQRLPFTAGEPSSVPTYEAPASYVASGGGGGGGGYGSGVSYADAAAADETVLGIPKSYLPWIAGGALLIYAMRDNS